MHSDETPFYSVMFLKKQVVKPDSAHCYAEDEVKGFHRGTAEFPDSPWLVVSEMEHLTLAQVMTNSDLKFGS